MQALVTVIVHPLNLGPPIMGAHKAEHTCMLIGRDCTTGGCGRPRRGGVTEEQECLSVCLPVCPVSLTDCLALAADKCQHKAWYLLPRTVCGCEDSLSVSPLSIFLSPSPFLPTISFSQPASISSRSIHLYFFSLSPLSLFLCSNSSPLVHLLSPFFGFPIYFLLLSLWQIGA